METVIGNIARAARKLASAGVESFVVTADHGHLFASRKRRGHADRRARRRHGRAPPALLDRARRSDAAGDDSGVRRRARLRQRPRLRLPDGSRASSRQVADSCYHHGGIEPAGDGRPGRDLQDSGGAGAGAASGAPFISRACPTRSRTARSACSLTLAVLTTEPLPVPRRPALGGRASRGGRDGRRRRASIATAGIVTLQPGTEASVGVMLTREDCKSVRLVVQDPATDAVLGQSRRDPREARRYERRRRAGPAPRRARRQGRRASSPARSSARTSSAR